jgi:hypothetical protein
MLSRWLRTPGGTAVTLARNQSGHWAFAPQRWRLRREGWIQSGVESGAASPLGLDWNLPNSSHWQVDARG